MLSPRDLEEARRRAFARVGRTLGLDAWPETVEVRWNHRLRRAGRAVIDGEGPTFERAAIELSPAYFENYPADLYGILVHEAVHVALAIQGRPFGHGPEFKVACLESGGLLHGRALPGLVYRYRCPVCGAVLERRRRLARDRWCADCVEEARGHAEREAAYAPERALVLVETAFAGPEGEGRKPDG